MLTTSYDLSLENMGKSSSQASFSANLHATPSSPLILTDTNLLAPKIVIERGRSLRGILKRGFSPPKPIKRLKSQQNTALSSDKSNRSSRPLNAAAFDAASRCMTGDMAALTNDLSKFPARGPLRCLPPMPVQLQSKKSFWIKSRPKLHLEYVDKMIDHDERLLTKALAQSNRALLIPMSRDVDEQDDFALMYSVVSENQSTKESTKKSSSDSEIGEEFTFVDHDKYSSNVESKSSSNEVDFLEATMNKPTKMLSRAGRHSELLLPSIKPRTAVRSKSAAVIPSLVNDPIQTFNFSASFSNLSNWKMGTNNPQVQYAYFECIKHIFIRENSLSTIQNVCAKLEESYWKYACLRIYATENKTDAFNNELVVELRHVLNLQRELAAAIAHFRAISMSVLESIQNLRKIVRNHNELDSEVSIYWGDENYILKMNHDYISIFNCQVIKMWMGFAPNCFMIPPLDFDPMRQWQSRVELYRAWLQKSDYFIKKKYQSQVSIGISIGVTATVLKAAKNFSNLSPPRSRESRDLAGVISRIGVGNHTDNDVVIDANVTRKPTSIFSSGSNIPITLKPGAPVASFPHPSKLQCVEVHKSDSLGTQTNKYHRKASYENVADSNLIPERAEPLLTVPEVHAGWKSLLDLGLLSWGTTEDPAGDVVWKDSHLDHLKVEATIGFPEAFPSVNLVNDLPQTVLFECAILQQVIDNELATMDLVAQAREQSLSVKRDVLGIVSGNDLDQIGERVITGECSNHKESLKRRQQSVEENTSFKRQQASKTSLGTTAVENDVDFFLTAASAAAADGRLGNTGTPTLPPLQVSRVSYLRIEEQVAAARSITVLQDGVRVLSEGVKRKRTKFRTIKDKQELLIKLQAAIRGYLVRLRAHKFQGLAYQIMASIRVKKAIRRYILRRRLHIQRHKRKIEVFTIRKRALLRRKAMRRVVKFLRWSTFVVQYARLSGLSALPPRSRGSFVRETRTLLFRAASSIQRKWRERMYRGREVQRRNTAATYIQMKFRRYMLSKRSHYTQIMVKMNSYRMRSDAGRPFGQLLVDDVDELLDRLTLSPSSPPPRRGYQDQPSSNQVDHIINNRKVSSVSSGDLPSTSPSLTPQLYDTNSDSSSSVRAPSNTVTRPPVRQPLDVAALHAAVLRRRAAPVPSPTTLPQIESESRPSQNVYKSPAIRCSQSKRKEFVSSKKQITDKSGGRSVSSELNPKELFLKNVLKGALL